MAVAGGPNIVEDGLVFYIDATNPQSYPITGTTSVGGRNGSVSNGTLTVLQETLPDGTTGNVGKLANTIFTNTVTVRNQTFACEGTATMEVFIKPVEYFYVKLRDGDTTNLQVDFDLINGTVVGGNNVQNGTITPYPNGWFLLTMTINRTTSFNFGTRIVIYPNDSFSNYDSTEGSGVLVYKLIVKSVSSSIVKDISNNNINGRLFNGASIVNNNFVLDGVDDYIDMGSYFYNNYTQHTAVAAFNTSDKNKLWGEILQKGYRSDFAIRQYGTTGRLQFFYVTNDGTYTYINDGLENDKWYIAVMSIDTQSGGKFKCYINGEKIYETNITTPTTLYEHLLYYGQLVSGRIFPSIEWFEGKISYLSMYDRQLSDSEVLQNYNALKSRFDL